ncbi:tail fiber protein (plasmid) [Escherichia coli]|uniref:tail fiber protein n=1 Tax=Escherichia coli TaxID=562 RepID=UPI00255C147A|nr:tail fiber protein [Escherichia coli]WIX50421.1 tail fiber protein [Escherichia coli]
MNDVTVVTSVTYPSPESLALVADVQYHEPYLSAALNRKFRGIVDPGFYAGFLPKPGGGMNLLITSVDGDKTAGAASVDIGEFYQVTIQHRKDISLALSAGKKYAIVLKGRYLLGEDTYQVNTASHIHAAEFVARTYTDSYQLGDGELLVCTVNIPAGVSAITQEMIDTSERINRTIGIDISDSVTSSRSDVAASSLAVKKAYDLAKSKYTAQDASTTQKGLVQLSSATNSDSETMAATPKAVKSVKDLADTKAPIESPSLTGTPSAPTAAQGTNSTQIANTAFVKAAITALINGAPGTLDTLKEIAAAINNDPNFSTTVNNALALKAPLASPALTGIPTAPTAAQGTNNTQIATTAYVRAAISALVGSSPEALDTLNELAAALGNDPNFATTMTNALAGKQPLDATLTALAGLATGANKLPYFTGTDTVSQTDLTSVGRDILAKTSVLAVIQYLGLRELGTSGEKIPLLSTANTWSARQIFNGGITGALTGNADTATKLKTARTIGGVAFDGTANINLPGVNVAGNQNTSGNAATATKLQTACTINGVSFDGSKNIELTAEDLNLQEFINKANNAVQRSGDILSGGLTFENDSILAWIRNTDWAKIGFKNDADSDTDSYMWFETGDNGNEYFKWRSKQSTTTKDLMNLKWDALSVLVKALFSSEVKISTVNALRIFNSSFGAIFRRSEECLHIIPTRENEGENGDIGPLRPFTLNLRTGRITMGHGLDVTGDITTNAWVYANRFAINSGSTSWIDMRNQNVIFGRNAVSTSSAQALLRQDHAERKFFVGGLGNYQFGFYMINNSRTANGTDGQAYMDNNGNWLCGAQVIPGNYGNFDSRYVKDVRLGSQQYYGVNNWQTWNFQCPSGHVLSGINVQDTGSNSADNIAGVYYRPVQKYINGTWYNVASV